MAGEWDVVQEAPTRPPGGAEAGGPWDVVSEAKPQRQVGAGETVARAGSGFLHAAKAYSFLPVAGGARLLDIASRAVGVPAPGGRTLEDRLGDVVVPELEATNAAALNPQTENAGAVGNVVIPAATEIGKSAPDLLTGVGLQGAGSRAIKTISEQALTHASAIKDLARRVIDNSLAGVPAGFRRAGERQSELVQAGVDPLLAAPQAATSGALTAAQFALPVSAGSAAATLPGRVLSRGAQGAALGTSAGVTAQQAEDAMAPASMGQNPLTPENLITQAFMNAMFGQMGGRNAKGGHPTREQLGYPKPLELASQEPTAPREPVPPVHDPVEAARLVNEALHSAPEGAPLPPDGLGLVPKETAMPGPINPDVSEVPYRVPAEMSLGGGGHTGDERLALLEERAQRQAGREPPRPDTVAVDTKGRAIPLDAEGRPTDQGSIAGLLQNDLARRAANEAEARKAFDVAEAQRQRKQSAQDTGSYTLKPMDLREARAGGTASPEGTAATAPEQFTFYNAKVRNGQMVEGDRVEVRGEPFMAKGESGRDVQMQSVRFVDRPGQPEMPVPVRALSSKERPVNPRFAQDIAATTYAPPKGVGTSEHQPAPREAAQRITTERSPEFIPAEHQTTRGEATRQGRDVTDLAFDRLPKETTHAGAVPAHQGQLPAPREVGQGSGAPSGHDVQRPPAQGGGGDGTELRGAGVDRGQAARASHGEPAQVAPKRKGSAFLQAVRKAGGIDPAFAAEVGGDSAMQLNRRLPGLMRKGGLSEDGLLEWATQNGYLSDAAVAEANKSRTGGGLQLAKDLMRRALGDEDVHTAAEAEAAHASSEQEKAHNDEAYHDYQMEHDPEYRAEQERMLGEAMQEYDLPQQSEADVNLVAEAARIDEVGVERLAQQADGGGITEQQFMEGIRRIVDGKQSAEIGGRGEAVQQSEGRPAPHDAGSEGGQGNGDQFRPPDSGIEHAGTKQGESHPPAFDLQRPTEHGLRADAAKRDAAGAEQRRVANAPSSDNFSLTGSERHADVAAAHGQKDLLNAGSSQARNDAWSGLAEADRAAVEKEVGRAPFELAVARWIEGRRAWVAEWLDTVSDSVRRAFRNAVAGLTATVVALNSHIGEAQAFPQPKLHEPVPIERIISHPKADFGDAMPSEQSRIVANYVLETRAAQDRAFIIADKADGRLYAFNKDGALLRDTPALYGEALADKLTPEQMSMSINKMTKADKITPAGKWDVKIGDYEGGTKALRFEGGNGLAIHSVYLGTPKEMRLERLASTNPNDKYITYGCINVPKEFARDVLASHFGDPKGHALFVLPLDSAKTAETFGIKANEPSRGAGAPAGKDGIAHANRVEQQPGIPPRERSDGRIAARGRERDNTGAKGGESFTPDSTEKKSAGGGTLYGGIPLDHVAKALSWAFGDVKAWHDSIGKLANDLRDAVAKSPSPEGNPFLRFLGAVLDSASGDMRGTLRKNPSKTGQWIMDQFHTEAGSDRATGEIYSSAISGWANKQMTRLDNAIKAFDGNKSALAQIAALVRNPQSIKAGTPLHDAAATIRSMLDDSLKYMKEAGVNIGEVRDGYYPREFDMRAVMRDTAGFIKATAQAFRESGMAPKDAEAAAKQLHDGMVFGESGSIFRNDRGSPQAPFLKGRVFGKQVDSDKHPLNAFLMHDPSQAIPIYLERAAKRAEIARRFGDHFEKWGELEKKVIAEGGGAALEKLRGYVTLAAKLKSPGVSDGMIRAASIARTWTSLMFLEKATLSSLTEFIVPAIRTGNPLDMGRSLAHTIGDLVLKTKGSAERRAFAEDLGIISSHLSDQVSAARFSGGEPVSMLESKILAKYFRRTGLTQWTDATFVSAADLGRVFVRRLAKELQGGGGKLNERYLAELGIPKEQQAEFSKYVLSKNDGMLTAGDMAGPMGDMYRTSIRRFAQQSIMKPDATLRPGWMAHPLGSIVGQLQSFNYAFFENVLKRNGRLAKEAVTGADYTMLERARLMMPMVMLPMLTAAAYAIGEARDSVFGDPEKRKEETGSQKVLKAISRGSPIAPIDPLLNYATSARYQRSAADNFAGPFLGTAGRGMDAARQVILNNTPKTNTAERQAAKAFYDTIIEPTINLMLTSSPVTLAAAAATQAAGSGALREKFTTAVAGPQKKSPPRPRYDVASPP